MSKSKKRNTCIPTRSLTFERLENREVFAVNAAIVGGILQVTGDATADSVEVVQIPDAPGTTWNGITLQINRRDNVTKINGQNSVTFSGIKGGLSIDLGEGSNFLAVRRQVNARGDYPRAVISGEVSIKFGSGNDRAFVYINTPSRFTADMGAGSDLLIMEGSTLGVVNINTDPALSSATDKVYLRAVSVKGAVGIDTGGGDDFVELYGDYNLPKTTVPSNVTINTGDGNDSVIYYAGNRYGEKVSIDTGAGDDSLLVAGDFIGGGSITTGPGKDSFGIGTVTNSPNIVFDAGQDDDTFTITGFRGKGTINGGLGQDTIVVTPNSSGVDLTTAAIIGVEFQV